MGKDKKEKNTNITISISPTAMGIGLFSIIAVIVLLTAVLALQEYVVSVCILVVLEAAMAGLLHKAELWKHGVLIVAQLLVGAVIQRVGLVLLCMLIYIVATVALQFMNRIDSE